MSIPLACVMTTIQEPTDCVRGLCGTLQRIGARVVVIGDKKGPPRFSVESADFFRLSDQMGLTFKLAKLLPTGHYARKNLGYLIAFERGAASIYETDDDNAPLPTWVPRSERCEAQKTSARPWLNVYRLFTPQLIWPRGFPLDQITNPQTYQHDGGTPVEMVTAPIQQGLANGAPDVDAVWRLVLDRPFDFEARPSVWLPPRTYCPFNSQTTWWWPLAYPLMYLPSYCSFRMTDIWRSFIAQRCLWEMGLGIVFHAAEAYQLRNTHNLIRDFKDEVSGYLGNDQLVSILNATKLSAQRGEVGANLRRCYEALIQERVFPPEEMRLVDAWLEDVAAVGATGSGEHQR